VTGMCKPGRCLMVMSSPAHLKKILLVEEDLSVIDPPRKPCSETRGLNRAESIGERTKVGSVVVPVSRKYLNDRSNGRMVCGTWLYPPA
jgi:hypothetical protein